MAYIIQQAADSDLRMPWPIRVEENRSISAGRPDAASLLGFQKGEEQSIDILADDGWTLEEVIGTYPVFSAKDGSGIFVIQSPITSITPA